ncbi:MAG: glutamine amidotransferase [Streptosporangiales bacterium]|nr:glutamine amidotransferase [Streptosporangiales bacterium]
MTQTSSLRIVWIYPDLLSTYGDRGNALVLEHRARLRGLSAEVVHVHSDEPVPTSGDIYLMGGGEDRPQMLAAERLRADGGLHRAVDAGAAVLAVCAGYQLLGAEFGDDQGRPVPGLGLLDMRSGRGERRAVGEIVGDVEGELGLPSLTGFENHQGVTHRGSEVRPLASVRLGVGNGDGTEGAWQGRVVGSYLHGPALVRNPALADLLLGWVAGPLPEVDDELVERLREERLTAVLPGA